MLEEAWQNRTEQRVFLFLRWDGFYNNELISQSLMLSVGGDAAVVAFSLVAGLRVKYDI